MTTSFGSRRVPSCDYTFPHSRHWYILVPPRPTWPPQHVVQRHNEWLWVLHSSSSSSRVSIVMHGRSWEVGVFRGMVGKAQTLQVAIRVNNKTIVNIIEGKKKEYNTILNGPFRISKQWKWKWKHNENENAKTERTIFRRKHCGCLIYQIGARCRSTSGLMPRHGITRFNFTTGSNFLPTSNIQNRCFQILNGLQDVVIRTKLVGRTSTSNHCSKTQEEWNQPIFLIVFLFTLLQGCGGGRLWQKPGRRTNPFHQ